MPFNERRLAMQALRQSRDELKRVLLAFAQEYPDVVRRGPAAFLVPPGDLAAVNRETRRQFASIEDPEQFFAAIAQRIAESGEEPTWQVLLGGRQLPSPAFPTGPGLAIPPPLPDQEV